MFLGSGGSGRVLSNLGSLLTAMPAAWLCSSSRLSRLAACEDPMGARLASLIGRFRSDALSGGEDWIDQIEAKRKELLNCHDESEGSTISTFCAASKKKRPATLLYHLIREFRPKTALELGTNLGISAAYQSAALEMNGKGRLFTIDLSAPRVKRARELHESLGLENTTFVVGNFSDTLGDVLEQASPLDYVFIDGHHQMEPTLAYFDTIYPHMTDDCIVIFDDIRWSSGMRRAWHTIQQDARIKIAVDLIGVGVCVTTRTPPAKHRHLTSAISV
ncbi:MAG: class I SAM-dependent methyltransferase [Planctomycetes bacterium]|nr:class I SAM-dependent methyltransferase [Planctomycetota bacterium]